MKKYYITRIRETEVEWIMDVQHFDPIWAENLKEAKAQVIKLYGSFNTFKKMQKKYHPEIAGCFYI